MRRAIPLAPPGRGLSLVELLVALALGVVLAFGAMNVLLRSKMNYLQAEELARLQENGRYALRYIVHELTMAGHLGSALPGTRIAAAESGSPCFDYLMATVSPLEHGNNLSAAGVPTGGGPPWPSDCLLASRHVAGSDALLVRRAAGSPSLIGGERLGAIDADGIYLRIARPEASAGAAPPLLQRGGEVAAQDELWEYLPQVLFLRDYSAASGDGIPTLCRKRPGRSSSRMAPTECLIEGIENLQLEFGIDVTGDYRADRFEPMPPAAMMGRAVAARIYLLVRSVHPVAGYSNDKSYALGNTVVPAAFDGYYRRVMQTTVLLRNTGAFRS